MKEIIFYEKPGCVTNAKQKRSLQRAGCTLIVKNLLNHDLSQEELLGYLEKRSVSQWFNPNAPAIKKGEIDPNSFNKEEALPLLFHNPILIRRPLISVEGYNICGFDKEKIESILGVSLDVVKEQKCISDTACPSPVSSPTSK